MATMMTAEDEKAGRELGAKLVMELTMERPPVATVACAFALASFAYLAECGPDAARTLFDSYAKMLAGAGAEALLFNKGPGTR